MSAPRFELRQEPNGRFVIRTLTVRLDWLPPEFEGYRIVQLTDFHRGPATALAHLEEAMRIVKALNPQLVLTTGDYVQYTRMSINHTLGSKVNPKVFGWLKYRRTVRAYAAEVGSLLAQLGAPDGIFGVYGNHDHHEGIGSIERLVGKAVKWLNNGTVEIARGEQKLLIAGVDDLKRGKPKLAETMRDISAGNHIFRILMAHNPDVTLHKEAADLQKAHLVLCGHTHGGQLCLPWWGPLATRTTQKKHVAGLTYLGETGLYVSSGIGYGMIGLRLFCPPEITVIELTR